MYRNSEALLRFDLRKYRINVKYRILRSIEVDIGVVYRILRDQEIQGNFKKFRTITYLG